MLCAVCTMCARELVVVVCAACAQCRRAGSDNRLHAAISGCIRAKKFWYRYIGHSAIIQDAALYRATHCMKGFKVEYRSSGSEALLTDRQVSANSTARHHTTDILLQSRTVRTNLPGDRLQNTKRGVIPTQIE